MTLMPRPTIALIAAVARNGAIGLNNALLVHLPQDLPRFKRLTMGCPIVMGRKTFQSIGKPLPGRRNIVISRDSNWHAAGVERAESLPAAFELASGATKLFVIGGGQIYAQAMASADEVHLTEIDADFAADAFFPNWPRGDFHEVSRETHTDPQGLIFSFVTYQRNKGD